MSMDIFFDQYHDAVEKIIEHFQRQLQSLRTGRATPSLVENVPIVAYNTKTPLAHLATICVSDSKTITIQPWDKSLMKAMESGLRSAELGISPVVDGMLIRITLPPITEENRKQLVKLVRSSLEETRITLRAQREKIKEYILIKEKEKGISEDDRFRLLKKLEDFIHEYSEEAEQIAQRKEKEIMTV